MVGTEPILSQVYGFEPLFWLHVYGRLINCGAYFRLIWKAWVKAPEINTENPKGVELFNLPFFTVRFLLRDREEWGWVGGK